MSYIFVKYIKDKNNNGQVNKTNPICSREEILISVPQRITTIILQADSILTHINPNESSVLQT